MRLPRRVPWASLAELDHVCGWIYADEKDLDAKVLAVNRLSAWRAITPLPHALDATLSLLSFVLLDHKSSHDATSDLPSSSASFHNAISALHVRHTYAMAIVRLVNGLVDPLQLGTYARSIASIAAQIGLPQWLVELRHAATHEELPSLELLRAGAKEALTWLLHNYFLPTLSSNVDQPAPDLHLPPIFPLLKHYKTLLKTTTRDASLKSQYKAEVTKVIRDIERWVGEAKVVASPVLFSGWAASERDEQEEENEKWALERLCEALLERGGLVPVSSKKRLASNSMHLPALPSSPIAIWSPLLRALQSHHPAFPSVLVSVIVNTMLYKQPPPKSEASSRKDLTYDFCLAAWAAWSVDQWDLSLGSQSQSAEHKSLRREDVVVSLVTSLGSKDDTESPDDSRGAKALLDLLVHTHPHLKELTSSLLPVKDVKNQTTQSWSDDDVQLMEARLNSFLSSLSADAPAAAAGASFGKTTEADNDTQSAPSPEAIELPEGWARIPESSWRACPIGVYAG